MATKKLPMFKVGDAVKMEGGNITGTVISSPLVLSEDEMVVAVKWEDGNTTLKHTDLLKNLSDGKVLADLTDDEVGLIRHALATLTHIAPTVDGIKRPEFRTGGGCGGKGTYTTAEAKSLDTKIYKHQSTLGRDR